MKNIHLIPTPNPSRLAILGMSNTLQLFDNLITFKTFGRSPQNIYITSDEEIKEGDLCLNEGDFDEHIIFKADSFFFNTGLEAKKIILTTDQDLIAEGIQQIDDEFLQWFVAHPSCELIEIGKTNKLIDNYAEKDEDKWEVKYHIYIPKEEPKCTCKEHDPYCCQVHGSCPTCVKKEEPKQDRTCTNNCSVVCGECQIFEPKQETLEEVKKVERTELFNSIFSVVKKIPRKDVDGDAMDAPSCAYEIEQLFYKWQQQQDKKLYSEEEVDELLNLLKQSVKEINHIKFTYKDKGHCVKYLSDRESIIEQFKKK